MNARVFPDDELTSRQRLLAAYAGQPTDRIPFWAKVANSTWRTSQPQTVRELDDFELLDAIRADGLFGTCHGARRQAPHVQVDRRRDGHCEHRLTRTPDGELHETWQLDPFTQSWHPTEFPVKTAADAARLRWAYRDCRYEIDDAQVECSRQRRRQVGDRGITVAYWGTSPLMDLVEHLAGPVGTHLLLADQPAAMDELIALMHADCLARASAVARLTAADVVVSVENTSTTLVSPEQFERYCLAHLCDYGRAIEAAGKIHELHMCGHTRSLLGRIDAIPAASIEAFTSPTLGNTRLADGRRLAPSKTLIGGTNVNVWLTEVEAIKGYVQAELDACPDHRRIVLTTAGVAPPACPADTFRQVACWLRTVPFKA